MPSSWLMQLVVVVAAVVAAPVVVVAVLLLQVDSFKTKESRLRRDVHNSRKVLACHVSSVQLIVYYYNKEVS